MASTRSRTGMLVDMQGSLKLEMEDDFPAPDSCGGKRGEIRT